ncbi:TetR/AcrR family transcriptional regulator C-terminal domain-containing protein [Streptomyces sp. NPDC001020]
MLGQAVDGCDVDEWHECGDRGQQLVVSRPAITPRNLGFMENALASLRAAGFPLGRALDVLYAVSGFVVGHIATVPSGADADQPTAVDPLHPLLDLDPEEFPLLTEAARTERRPSGPNSRFDFALDAMLSGFDAARCPHS